jgi:hypothetical protein
LLGGIIVLDQRDARTLGKLADSTGEIDVLIVHYKSEDATSGTTTEAVESLSRWIHMKGGALLLVKGTEAPKASPRTFQREITADDLYDIAGLGDLLNTLFGDTRHEKR